MLSRTARNAYSWWWASHIRTKQSKWLDQNIQDMEEKVDYILKIITEDGDSFRTRAEQYYRKRPEIVNFVEDNFREYRALAERYDHLSKDLQSANRTIAIIFPERVQMSIDEDDYYEEATSNFDENENKIPPDSHVPMPPKQNHPPKMENVVQAMLIKQKSKMPTKWMSKNGLINIGVDENASRVSKSSGLNEDEALEEIDRLQKDILGFQTEKEFVKTSYESTLSKYWEIENNINEMHAKISNLHHEFGAGAMIEDIDAQTQMSSSALKMCKVTIDKLKHKQKRFKEEAKVEHKKIGMMKKKFESLIACDNNNSNLGETIENVKDKKAKIEEKLELKSFEGSIESQTIKFDQKEDEDIEDKKARMKEEILGTNEPITISEVAEKIEQLVEKVITLEIEVTSQVAMVMRLKLELDELHEHLETLEHEKQVLVDDSNNTNIKIKRLEKELERVQILDRKVKEQNVHLETGLDEASVCLHNLFKELSIAKPDENIEEDNLFVTSEKDENKKFPKLEEENGSGSYKNHDATSHEENHEKKSDVFVTKPSEEDEDEDEDRGLSESVNNKEQYVDFIGEEDDEPDWKPTYSHKMEDREKMLLEEYSSTLKSYKEVKNKLNEIEKRNRANSFRSAVQMKMLRNSNEKKDEEIRSLHEKVKLFETHIERLTMEFEVKKASDHLDHGEIKETTRLNDEKETRDQEDEEFADFEQNDDPDFVDEETQSEYQDDEATEMELQNASDETKKDDQPMKSPNLVDQETQRRDELDETNEYEPTDALDLVDEDQIKKKIDETNKYETTKNSPDLVDEDQIKKKIDERNEYETTNSPYLVDEDQIEKKIDETNKYETTNSPDLVDDEDQIKKKIDEMTYDELKKARDLVDERTQKIKELENSVNEAHEILEIEEEIHTEIEELRKDNLQLWLRFSTSYHQINRFQDSYNDLVQEIKQLKEKKQERGTSGKHHHNFASDIRPLYRHLREMQTEVILWLEKSAILEDDLQHRLTSLSDIQNELTHITNDGNEKTDTPLNNYKAAKFQGEVLNMKQENVKVLDELKVASERVKTLEFDIEKTLSNLDEELGKRRKSNSISKVPFRSFLFGAKLRKKRNSKSSSNNSMFASCMSPSVRRQSGKSQRLPKQPREDSGV